MSVAPDRPHRNPEEPDPEQDRLAVVARKKES
jgi:hypothetical protein